MKQVADLILLKEVYIANVDAEFRRQQGSVFVDNAKRDELRAVAIDAVLAIRSAVSAEDAGLSFQQCVKTMIGPADGAKEAAMK